MHTLSSQIEQYIRIMMDRYDGIVEIQRKTLADRFSCAPSQINYVLKTRFSPERGFVIESQRGEGGYIRIYRSNRPPDLSSALYRQIGQHLTQDDAENFLQRLEELEAIDKRKATLMRWALRRELELVDPAIRPLVRGALLRSMLLLFMHE
jgi:transcriptional regulator CtsR